MFSFPNWLNQASFNKFKKANLNEEYRKKIFVLTCITIAIPVLTGYGIVFLISKKLILDAVLNFMVAACFLVIACLIKITSEEKTLYRIGMAVLAFLIVYNVGFGPHGESETLWLLVIPLANFYLFGTREGIIWIVLFVLPSALFVLFPEPFMANSYQPQFRIALFVSLTLSTILSYMLESLRAYFIFRIEKKNTELKSALSDIKKLSGLLPICSSCKKVRDDRGYWNQIEEYIRTRSEAEFSHSLCPDCSDKMYGGHDWYVDLKKQKKIT